MGRMPSKYGFETADDREKQREDTEQAKQARIARREQLARELEPLLQDVIGDYLDARYGNPAHPRITKWQPPVPLLDGWTVDDLYISVDHEGLSVTGFRSWGAETDHIGRLVKMLREIRGIKVYYNLSRPSLG